MLRNLSLQELDQTIQKFYDESSLETECQVLRNQVSDSSKWESNIDLTTLRFPTCIRSLDNKLRLAILHWYMPEEVRWLINLWLTDHWGNDFKEVKSVILTSKNHTLGWLLIQERWSDRDFFGNVLCKGAMSWFSCSGPRTTVRFKSKTGRVKKAQRHRGYRDKGSKRPEHDVPRVDYRKIRTVEEQYLLELELQRRVQLLFLQVEGRLQSELRNFW